MSQVKRKRTYDSSRRQQSAAESRAAVLSAASRLFREQGFGATTIDQIAGEAGVSKPTVFASVGNKVQVFSAVRDVAMAGDDEPVSVTQRPSVAAIADAGDLPTALRAAVRHVRAINARYRQIDAVLRGASGSDPAMRELFETAERQRHIGAGHLLARLRKHGALAMPAARAQDLLWLAMAPDHYARLVDDRGWSESAYERWLRDQIAVLFK